jgi:hypothetical protein
VSPGFRVTVVVPRVTGVETPLTATETAVIAVAPDAPEGLAKLTVTGTLKLSTVSKPELTAVVRATLLTVVGAVQDALRFTVMVKVLV